MLEKPTYEDLEKRVQSLEKAEHDLKKARSNIEHRFTFEQLIAKISSEFAGISGESIDPAINHALATIGVFTGADRAYVFQSLDDNNRMDNTHEWCANTIEPQIEKLKNISIDQELPWFSKYIRNHEIFHVPDVSKMPPEAKNEQRHFEAQDIQSLIAVPMQISKQIIGFLGFDSVRNHRVWSDGDIALLRFFGQTLSHILGRQRAEEALIISEARLNTIFEKAAEGICVCNNIAEHPYVKFTYWNPKMIDITGYTIEEINRQGWYQSMYPDAKMRQKAINRMARMRENEDIRVEEWNVVTKSGEKKTISISTSAIKRQMDEVHVIAIMQDITERKKSEAALRESEEKYRTILEKMEDGYFEVDAAGNFTFYNQAMCNILGYNNTELMGMNNREFMNAENAEKVYRAFNYVFRTGKSYKAFDWELIKKDGTTCNVETSVALIKDEKEKPIGFKGIARDITERKKSAKALQDSEARYRLLADNVNDNIWVFDLETLRFSYVSPSVKGVTGYSSEEATGFQLEDTLTPASLDLANQTLEEELIAASQNFDPVRSRTFELEQYHKNGSTVWTEVVVRFIYDDKQQPIQILGVTRDISERKKFQEKLYKSQKMESLGLLAGGVAHDLNNVLSGIVSYPELILMNLPEDSSLRKPLKTIMDSGNKAVAIVQDLLTIARGVAINKEPLKLNDLVSDYLNSNEFRKLRHYYPEVTFKTHFAKDLFNIEASNVHIIKVIMNLVANATEVVNENGVVSIATANRYLDMPLNGYEEINAGDYVILSITDNGPGISSKDFEKIFEPFYTKKKMGRSGTGLGLSVVWSVIRDHKGFVDVKTDVYGTSFELYFPITHDTILKKVEPVSVKELQGSGETVLVVDDIESQREISCRMLDMLGYQSEAVSSGEAAIDYLQHKPVDLVLLDMIMEPGMSGYETYKRIIKIQSDQKAIILSGFSETDKVKKTQALGAGKYLKKPVTLEKLGMAIKEELEK